jgi:MFS transporter, DHA1 family, multidrug resistance protein
VPPHDVSSQTDTTADYTALRLPIMLGAVSLATLPFLLPIYGKQLGATAVGIGSLFAAMQFMIVLTRPLIGWTIDSMGRKGFFITGVAFSAGAMGLFALANNLTTLYLAQLLQGIASACTWTSVYTMTTELAMPGQQGKAIGRVDEYSHRGGLYGMVLAIAFLSWLSLDIALRVLFLSYAALAAGGVWTAWTQTPETRSASPAPSRPQVLAAWPIVKVLLVVFLTYVLTAMLRPMFLVFLHDEFTTDVRLLALAFLPAVVLESVLPSRLGRLSDRWGRRPLIIAGLTWIGLSCFFVPVCSQLAWIIMLWTLKALGLAAALPPQKALISDYTARTKRGTGYGLYTFTTSLGTALGSLLGGWVYDTVGHAMPFFLAGVVLIASPGWASPLLQWQEHGGEQA